MTLRYILPEQRGWKIWIITWLIPPVVICLSQSLSHASVTVAILELILVIQATIGRPVVVVVAFLRVGARVDRSGSRRYILDRDRCAFFRPAIRVPFPRLRHGCVRVKKGTCPWCNGYRRKKCTRQHEFKSWTRLIAFHIALIPLGKVWIQLFSFQLWVNSRAD